MPYGFPEAPENSSRSMADALHTSRHASNAQDTQRYPARCPQASDPAKQQDLREELKNAFRPTPKGLETPAYKVRAVLEGPRRGRRRGVR